MVEFEYDPESDCMKALAEAQQETARQLERINRRLDGPTKFGQRGKQFKRGEEYVSLGTDVRLNFSKAASSMLEGKDMASVEVEGNKILAKPIDVHDPGGGVCEIIHTKNNPYLRVDWAVFSIVGGEWYPESSIRCPVTKRPDGWVEIDLSPAVEASENE